MWHLQHLRTRRQRDHPAVDRVYGGAPRAKLAGGLQRVQQVDQCGFAERRRRFGWRVQLQARQLLASQCLERGVERLHAMRGGVVVRVAVQPAGVAKLGCDAHLDGRCANHRLGVAVGGRGVDKCDARLRRHTQYGMRLRCVNAAQRRTAECECRRAESGVQLAFWRVLQSH